MTSVTSAPTDQTSAHARRTRAFGRCDDPFPDDGNWAPSQNPRASWLSAHPQRYTVSWRRPLHRRHTVRCSRGPSSLRDTIVPDVGDWRLASPKLPLACIEFVELAEPAPLDGTFLLSIHLVRAGLGAQNVEEERLVAVPRGASPPLDVGRLRPPQLPSLPSPAH